MSLPEHVNERERRKKPLHATTYFCNRLLPAPFPLRDLPLRAPLRSVFLQRPLTAPLRSAPLHPIFGPLCSVFRSAEKTLRSQK